MWNRSTPLLFYLQRHEIKLSGRLKHSLCRCSILLLLQCWLEMCVAEEILMWLAGSPWHCSSGPHCSLLWPCHWEGMAGVTLLEPVSAYRRRVFRVTFFKQGSGRLGLARALRNSCSSWASLSKWKIVRHAQSRETYKVREFREVGAMMIYLTVNTCKLSMSTSGRSAMLWNWQKIALNRDLKKPPVIAKTQYMVPDIICQPEQQASVDEHLATYHRKHAACCSEQELEFYRVILRYQV